MAMTRENIVQMAMKAGFIVGNAPPKIDVYWQRLEDFAALIAAAEREACAKVCEEAHWSLDDRNEYAAAIRARSNNGL